ncbi:MAG: L-seryl-tRNA(Sec) selenium transferase [Mariniblastus sp.]
MANIFRKLPSVNQLLESPQLKQMVKTVNHSVVVDGVRSFLDDLRDQVSTESGEVSIPTPSEIADKIANWIKTEEKPYLRPVINGTGIILHTGLGRAPLAKSAIESVQEISEGYASVEVDVRTGERGQRIKSVEKLLCELTGAEAAAVVNNNAAATMLALSAMAEGREVIVSRGQLIEIGGSYRLPDVMECSGAKLREVGTTNKTHLFDYQRAINEETGALLKVHPSNFEVVGFTKTVSTKEMVALASEHDLPVIDDVGSGALIDFSEFGLMDEPVVSQSIKDGADVVLFSGDKLIGGPQCGIIIGKRKYIDTILSNPLMRAMRVDKMTLAALSATLLIYRDGNRARTEIPILRMLSMPKENLKLRAEKIVAQLSHLGELEICEAVEADSMLGGGSLPTQKLSTWCVALTPKTQSVDRLAAGLRNGEPSVIGRVQKERFFLDMRTVQPSQDSGLVESIEAYCDESNSEAE